ncbi:MAG: cyclic nucleotide-binding domain-containing protein [Candidatus Xenobia bacterium]
MTRQPRPETFVPLPRGGVLLTSPLGPIQYGAVPETIKDTMESTHGVPTVFVMPPHLFDAERGINMAEIEFPAYWNTFCRNTTTTLVCRSNQREHLVRMLSEAVFGPKAPDAHEQGHPDLVREMAWFRNNPKTGKPMQLEDLVDIREFDESGKADMRDGVQIALEDHNGVAVLYDGRKVSEFLGDPPMPSLRFHRQKVLPFTPPGFGVTVIGSGHGFDPGNRTSGFIIWIDGRGVMVDPPVDAVEWVNGYDIGPREIDSLILTHCHADHDAGTLQKLLQEGRVTIYTTPTVLSSFVAKYAHLLGMEPAAFRRLFDHVPVRAGETISLHGAQVTFNYSLHSIPCAGFEMFFRGRSLVYPSDTLNDPEVIRNLRDEGVLTQERARQLADFPWHHQLVLHEAGIPPIHTPVRFLAGLDDAIKKRLLLVHVSARTLPPESGLKIAPTGVENTIDLHASRDDSHAALEVLDVVSRVDIFADLPLEKAADLLRCIDREVHPAGTQLVRKGDPGEKFYMILSGSVGVYKDDLSKVYGQYDYFGESALVTGEPRTADVYAKTNVVLLTMHRNDFLNLLRGTDVAHRLVHLAELRKLPTWELLMQSHHFGSLTANQITQLQQFMEPVQLQAGEAVGSDPVVIEHGHAVAERDGHPVRELGRGEFAGDAAAIRRGVRPRIRFVCRTTVSGYRIKTRHLKQWFKKNPGVYLRLAQQEVDEVLVSS